MKDEDDRKDWGINRINIRITFFKLYCKEESIMLER